MTAFERRVADGMRHRAGPICPVDDLAVYELVVAASRSRRWGFTLLSAARLAAAAAIVTLFGGLLLAGILTSPRHEGVLPAAVTASPSPMPTEALLSGMVTQEVEPGVHRIIEDGVRELMQQGTPSDIVAGPDGSVWLGYEGRWLRLGRTDESSALGEMSGESEVAPDGSLWNIANGNVYEWDGESWTQWDADSQGLAARGLAIAPDGTVWVTEGDTDGETTHLYRLARPTDEGLTAVPDWTGIHPRAAGWGHMVVAPDSDVWLVGEATPDLPGYDNGGPTVDAFLRFDGSEWHSVAVPDDLRWAWGGQSFDIGVDGTLWAAVGRSSEDEDGLARLDGSGWTVFTETDGVRPWGTFGFIPTDHLHVAPDGSVWVNAEGDGSTCGGVANFDGSAWTSFLPGLCVHDMDIAHDGAVWVQAGTYAVAGGFEYWDTPHTFVITPDAMAATD
jgi:hypothetical protein